MLKHQDRASDQRKRSEYRIDRIMFFFSSEKMFSNENANHPAEPKKIQAVKFGKKSTIFELPSDVRTKKTAIDRYNIVE